MPGYRSGILAITVLNYNREAIISNCLSGNIKFIEGRKEALEQLDKEIWELNNTNQTARLVSQALPILAAAIALLYRK